mgnify:CR=1 FL=1
MSDTPDKAPGGIWVPRDLVSPAANVSGRAFRRQDGTEGVFPDVTMNPVKLTHWYFATEKEPSE